MQQDVETQFRTIDQFIKYILDDMRKISMSTRKADTMAYNDAWRTELTNIKNIMYI